MDFDHQISLAMAFDHSDMAFCVIHVLVDQQGKPYDWVFVYLNDALAKLEGVPKERLLNTRFFEIFPQADVKWFDYYYPAAYENKSFIFEDISEEIGVYLRVHCFPVAQGYCGCILEDTKDLHESRQREIAGDSVIQGLARGYESVWFVKAEKQSVHLYQGDEETDRLSVADYNEWMEGFVRHYVHPDNRELVLQKAAFGEIHRKLQQNGIYEIQFKRQFGGHTEAYQMTAVAAGNCDDFVIAIRNINDIVKEQEKQKTALEVALDAAKRASVAKSIFLSNMSHDIRTPMNAIIGFTTLAMMHIDKKELVRDYLTKIETSGNHLLLLINDILDMSYIESGKIHLEEEECNLLEILHDLRDIMFSDLEAKNLNLLIDTIDVFNEEVICDRLRLNQILLNITSNAMKFTEAGGTISILLIQKNESHPEIANYEFHIKDTGIGMDADFLEHIFDPFERERNSTISGIQGTGLGMAITKNLVNMMSGTIKVNSEKGVGTEFVISLPFQKADYASKSTPVEGLNGTPAPVEEEGYDNCGGAANTQIQMGMQEDWSMSGKRLLLVDDNELNREIAVDIMSEFGVVVEEAENGQEAIQYLLQHGGGYYDAVLMDVQMPVMDGYEAAKRIRAMDDKALAQIPIIAVTANAFAEDKQRALEIGMNAHIVKPIQISELFQTIRSLM